MHVSFHRPLRKILAHILCEKLNLFKLVNMNSRYITLTVVPLLLYWILFIHYHVGNFGEHMRKYKTLFRFRLRFFRRVCSRRLNHRWSCEHIVSPTLFSGLKQMKRTSLDQSIFHFGICKWTFGLLGTLKIKIAPKAICLIQCVTLWSSWSHLLHQISA